MIPARAVQGRCRVPAPDTQAGTGSWRRGACARRTTSTCPAIARPRCTCTWLAAPRFRNPEWFHDHVRIEHMLFDGAPVPTDGAIRPDLTRPGLGIEFKRQDAERFKD